MSVSLVRKSLELFGYNDVKHDKKSKRMKKSNTNGILSDKRNTNIQKKKGITIISNCRKLSVQQAKEYLESQIDPTEENVQKLLKLSTHKNSVNNMRTILDRVGKKENPTKHTKQKGVENTGFSEKDLKTFMEEYEKLEQ